MMEALSTVGDYVVSSGEKENDFELGMPLSFSQSNIYSNSCNHMWTHNACSSCSIVCKAMCTDYNTKLEKDAHINIPTLLTLTHSHAGSPQKVESKYWATVLTLSEYIAPSTVSRSTGLSQGRL